ncbi:hypothetical protein BJ322DRAFT_1088080 [Thelephora terrestris]|uniref:Uncharacterized protein n=1 Tax=Thelephora terrestris TaxID=56493 RepID=A0A9P6L2N0_9AGAM|nr:hypothetical protein BJ322DRAFT_1088080 [Thelephora terrestris]
MDNADGVKALLDKLKSSTAWKQAIAASDPPVPTPHESHASSDPDFRPSIASLLAQLAGASAERSEHPGPPPPSVAEPRPTEPVAPALSPAPDVAPPPSSTGSDRPELHAFPFQQSLSHLAHLSAKPGFIESIRQIQIEQSALESQLWDERLAIQQKHQEKVKVAVTRAKLIGSGGLSQFEADISTQAYKRELHKFDTQRAIVAWDALVSKQQATLESLGVPVMHVSHLTSDTEKQQRVVRVLESIVEGSR